MFYGKFIYLCALKQVMPSQAAVEAGISKSLVSKWKANPEQTPSPKILQKISDYFSVPISELLSEEKVIPASNSLEDPQDQIELSGTEIMYIKLLRRIHPDKREKILEEILSNLDS